MRSAAAIRKEHKAVCAKIKKLELEADKAGWQGPLEKDELLYFRLYSIKLTLEWVLPILIRTPKLPDVNRRTQLMGYRHYAARPLHALLYP